MELQVQQLDNNIKKINLTGSMDIAGTGAIDLQFTAQTATRKARIIVDMSEVDFLASIGIRTLLSNARALKARGGKMVLLSPQAMVLKVLQTTGTDTLIPIATNLDSAVEMVQNPEE